eukprot:gene77-54_t
MNGLQTNGDDQGSLNTSHLFFVPCSLLLCLVVQALPAILRKGGRGPSPGRKIIRRRKGKGFFVEEPSPRPLFLAGVGLGCARADEVWRAKPPFRWMASPLAKGFSFSHA